MTGSQILFDNFMKYYLAANFKTSYQSIIDDWCVFQWKKLWLILNAADMYTERDWIDENVDLIRSLGCEIIDIDLRVITKAWLNTVLDQIDILHVNWWSSFYLMKLILEKWFKDIFSTLSSRRNLIYVWSSAGSIIMCQDMWWVIFLDKWGYFEKLQDHSWFDIVPYSIVPHRWREKYTDIFHDSFVAKQFNHNVAPILLMRDEQVIIVDEEQKNRIIS